MRSAPKKSKEPKKEPIKEDKAPKEAEKLLTITDIPQVEEENDPQPPASVSDPMRLHQQENPRAGRYQEPSDDEIASLRSVQDQEDIRLELPDDPDEAAPFAEKSPGA
jgi:hypothetical protein